MERTLIDTNVWIDYLNLKSEEPHYLKTLLSTDSVSCCEYIELELRSGSIPLIREKFLKSISLLPKVAIPDWQYIFSLVEKEKLYGKGLNSIDLIIYSIAKFHSIKVWTFDKNLKKLLDSSNLLFLYK